MVTLTFFCPHRGQEANAVQEAQVLGHITWLWLQSPLHRDWPCHLLQSHVIAAMRRKQYVLVGNGSHPVGYASWALLSDEAQQSYLQDPSAIRSEDWQSGNHMWWIDWVVPFGHTHAMAAYFKAQIFPQVTARALRVKRDRTVGRIIDFHGDQVPVQVRSERRRQFAAQFRAMAQASKNTPSQA